MTTCSAAAAEAGEQLIGSASQAEHWLLLEVRTAWGRDAVADTHLPAAVRARLSAWLDETPRSRVLFLRKPERRTGPLSLFVANVAEHGGELRHVELEQLGDLRDAELTARGGYRDVPVPLWLVCTHGRRDACCARFGPALYDALAAHLPREALWQSSHQGGHRFAANLLVLPHGVQLGRVRPVEAERVVSQLSEGVLPLQFYRGRSIHPPAAQVAELAVRERLGAALLTSIRYAGATPDDERYRFETHQGVVEVAAEERVGPPRPESCGAEPTPSTRYRVRF